MLKKWASPPASKKNLLKSWRFWPSKAPQVLSKWPNMDVRAMIYVVPPTCSCCDEDHTGRHTAPSMRDVALSLWSLWLWCWDGSYSFFGRTRCCRCKTVGIEISGCCSFQTERVWNDLMMWCWLRHNRNQSELLTMIVLQMTIGVVWKQQRLFAAKCKSCLR